MDFTIHVIDVILMFTSKSNWNIEAKTIETMFIIRAFIISENWKPLENECGLHYWNIYIHERVKDFIKCRAGGTNYVFFVADIHNFPKQLYYVILCSQYTINLKK